MGNLSATECFLQQLQSGKEAEHTWRITDVEARTLEAPLHSPFVIAKGSLDRLQNVAIKVTLARGTVGWGEVPTLRPVTEANQAKALAAAQQAGSHLVGRDSRDLVTVSADLQRILPAQPSVWAGLEMAVIDAVARAQGLPLYRLFGGATNTLTTDITIPICAAAKAQHLAAQYNQQGFETIKTKVGCDVSEDVLRLQAIRRGHPTCRLVVDANEGYTIDTAFEALERLHDAGIDLALLEQPVARNDWEGMGRLARECGVPVAADESCRTLEDAQRITTEGLAQVINIKLAKAGVLGALRIIDLARSAGLGLMMGGMVETRISMGFAAHLAAGVGGFDWIDLDTPLLLASDPVCGGHTSEGPRYRLVETQPGHGAKPKTWERR